MEYFLIVLAFSLVPFIGICLQNVDSSQSRNPDCFRSNNVEEGLLEYFLDSLSMVGFKGFDRSFLSAKAVQIAAVIIHTSNGLLLQKLIDNFLKLQRDYVQHVRGSCSTLMCVLFAVHSTRIVLLKDTTMGSLSILLSLSFGLIGSILALNFLNLYNNGVSSIHSLSIFVASSIMLFLSAMANISTLMISIIIIIAVATGALKLQKHSSTWIDIFNRILLPSSCMVFVSFIYFYNGNSNITEGFSKIRSEGEFFNDLSEAVDFPQHFLQTFQVKTKALIFVSNYIEEKISTLKALQFNSEIQLETIYPLFEVATVITLLIALILQIVSSIVRWKSISNFTFSCLGLLALLAGACSSLKLSNKDSPHYDKLAIGLYSYVPSSFLTFCLAVALADACSVPVLSGSESYTLGTPETVVLIKPEAKQSVLYESLMSVIHTLFKKRKQLDVETTRYMDDRSKTELRGELVRLDQQRMANSPVKSKGSKDRRDEGRRVHTTPKTTYLANKAFQLMVLTALIMSIETIYTSFNPEQRCFFKSPVADTSKGRRGRGRDQKEDMVFVCCPL
mmetsp:Transcript_33304/g.31767  ORF Transcript_33304/g.31767 Transcript_33304/m.31767 type:complete len:562 (+) Transcript_33304:162-1847(+)